MKHSKKRFFGIFSVATVAVGTLVFLILSAQIAMATLPVVGMGGMFLTADSFNGNDAIVYPEKGTIDEERDVVTDTTACEERPMLVFDLGGAEAENFALYKDIEVPYFDEQWLTIQIIEEDGGSIEAENAQLYVTQLEADLLEVDNVRLAEAGPDPDVRSTDKFGPESGEFILDGDPEGTTPAGEDNLRSTNAKAWLHALTGQSVTIEGDGGGFVNIETEFVDNDDLLNRYDQVGMDSLEITEREDYFDCLPGT